MAIRPIAVLRNLANVDDIDDPFQDPAYARNIAFQRLEPRPTPDDPDWFATMYYDPAKFPVEACFERIARHYAATMPGRSYRLKALPISELKRFGLVKYPRTEETFRRRGFVSDIEARNFEKGENTFMTTYLAHNRAAASFQLVVIETFMQPSRAASQRGEAHG